MSRIFMDGFESGSMDLWSSSAGVTLNSSLAGRSGAYCADLTTNPAYMIINVPSDDEYYLAFKYYESATNYNAIVSFYENATKHAYLYRYLSASDIYLVEAAGTTIVATGPGAFPISTWVSIEVYIKIANSGGRCIVKINGITCIDYTGDLQNGGTGIINSIRFGFVAINQYGYCYLDDVIIDNANWIGSTSIQGLAVTGAGNSAQFDPSTGNNYACVDEIPPSDADYISTNVPNEIDTYACGDLTGTINSVKAVQVQARCVQEGSPAVPKIQLVTRPTSTDRVSASKSVQTFAPGVVSNIWELNPDDSAAWESADVNGMEIGVKAVAS